MVWSRFSLRWPGFVPLPARLYSHQPPHVQRLIPAIFWSLVLSIVLLGISTLFFVRWLQGTYIAFHAVKPAQSFYFRDVMNILWYTAFSGPGFFLFLASVSNILRITGSTPLEYQYKQTAAYVRDMNTDHQNAPPAGVPVLDSLNELIQPLSESVPEYFEWMASFLLASPLINTNISKIWIFSFVAVGMMTLAVAMAAPIYFLGWNNLRCGYFFCYNTAQHTIHTVASEYNERGLGWRADIAMIMLVTAVLVFVTLLLVFIREIHKQRLLTPSRQGAAAFYPHALVKDLAGQVGTSTAAVRATTRARRSVGHGGNDDTEVSVNLQNQQPGELDEDYAQLAASTQHYDLDGSAIPPHEQPDNDNTNQSRQRQRSNASDNDPSSTTTTDYASYRLNYTPYTTFFNPFARNDDAAFERAQQIANKAKINGSDAYHQVSDGHSQRSNPTPFNTHNDPTLQLMQYQAKTFTTRQLSRNSLRWTLVFLIMLSIGCFLLCTFIPNTWRQHSAYYMSSTIEKYTPADLSLCTPESSYSCPEYYGAFLRTHSWRITDHFTMQFYPSIIIFYIYIAAFALFAVILQSIPQIDNYLSIKFRVPNPFCPRHPNTENQRRRRRRAAGANANSQHNSPSAQPTTEADLSEAPEPSRLQGGAATGGWFSTTLYNFLASRRRTHAYWSGYECLWLGWTIIFGFLWFHYWFFSHKWKSAELSTPQIWLRSSGQVSVFILASLFFPVARNSPLLKLVGVSWEYSIQYHRWLGSAFLVGTLWHMSMAYWAMGSEGVFPKAVLSTPLLIAPHGDWSVMTIQFVTWFTFFTMGVLTLEWVRRRFYWLFLYSHHLTYVILVPIVLWHAIASWEFLLPPLSLYISDRFIRWFRGTQAVEIYPADVSSMTSIEAVTSIRQIVQHSDESQFVSNDAAPSTTGKYPTISPLCDPYNPESIPLGQLLSPPPIMSIHSPLPIPRHEIALSSAPLVKQGPPQQTGLRYIKCVASGKEYVELRLDNQHLNHIYFPGHYAFLNIAEVSLFEWHPFTISSPAHAMAPKEVLFVIESHGPGTWSGQFVQYVRQYIQQLDERSILQDAMGPTAAVQFDVSQEHSNEMLFTSSELGSDPYRTNASVPMTESSALPTSHVSQEAYSEQMLFTSPYNTTTATISHSESDDEANEHLFSVGSPQQPSGRRRATAVHTSSNFATSPATILNDDDDSYDPLPPPSVTPQLLDTPSGDALPHPDSINNTVDDPETAGFTPTPFPQKPSPMAGICAQLAGSDNHLVTRNDIHMYTSRFVSVPLTVSIDGPYGTPMDFSSYQYIFLVGGGLGITPVKSIYESLLLSYLHDFVPHTVQPGSVQNVISAGALTSNFDTPASFSASKSSISTRQYIAQLQRHISTRSQQRVHLHYVARDIELFDLLHSSLRHVPIGPFSAQLALRKSGKSIHPEEILLEHQDATYGALPNTSTVDNASDALGSSQNTERIYHSALRATTNFLGHLFVSDNLHFVPTLQRYSSAARAGPAGFSSVQQVKQKQRVPAPSLSYDHQLERDIIEVIYRDAMEQAQHGLFDWDNQTVSNGQRTSVSELLSNLQNGGNNATDLPPVHGLVDPSKVLLFVCGPNAMIKDVEEVCYKYGFHFHAETFEL